MSAFKFAAAGLFVLALVSTNVQAEAAPPVPAATAAPGIGLAEPLVRTKPTVAGEDKDLDAAVDTFRYRKDPSDLSSLNAYLAVHPHSGWSTALWTNLGLSYLHDGYFSRAIDAWQTAWAEGRDATSPEGRRLADRAVGELARLEANLGRTDDLKALFDQLGSRSVSGAATESLQNARDVLTLARSDPRHLFNCGPLALRALLLTQGMSQDALLLLQFYNSGPDGTTLADLGALADRLKVPYQLLHRQAGDPVPVPSVIHWRVGHFAAIVGKENGRYHVYDAVFPSADIWVTQKALDTEASGYFLAPEKAGRNAHWTPVTIAEAQAIRGKGPTNGGRQGGAGDPPAAGGPPPPDGPGNPGGSGPPAGGGPGEPEAGGPGNPPSTPPLDPNPPPKSCNTPLCMANIAESSVSITLTDTPVGYVPPIGPSMKIGISYNQREDSQPANFSYSNLGQKWSMSWIDYIIDDPTNPGANVSRIRGIGGAFYYIGYDAVRRTFAAQDTDGSILALAAQSPVSYRRQFRNGWVEIYQQSDGSTSYPRKIFLSKVIDPQGNAATLHYDSYSRLTSITDAVGRNTTFSYNVSGSPLLISAITDPFGRSAKLTYDSSGRLSSVTDIIGLTSSFTYDANSLISSLTTPYGTSNFKYTVPGTSGPPRFAQITDPLGNKERVEWLEPAPISSSDPSATVPVGMPLTLKNEYLQYRNSFYWDPGAYVTAGCTDTGGCDYTKARLRHFVHMPGTSIKGTAVESEKSPLENRIWYVYPGQSSSVGTLYGGTYDKPIAIGRVLDDGTSQISVSAYNSSGNLTQTTDPSGRVTNYAYSNGIDLAAISQATEFGTISTLAQYLYNGQHRPVYYIDAAGRVSSYTYNATGQMTSFTDPLNEKTTYQYDSSRNLTSITNANNATAAIYTYDAYNRVRTFTDSEGWAVTYDYDADDRVTKITYPDGTSTRYTYQRLELVSYKDREGRLWQYRYDANRRLIGIADPLRQTITLGYDPAGRLTSLTDAKGNVTSWAYDVQGRQVSKTYSDNSTVTYTYESTTSRLKNILDALGQAKQFSYAIDDSLTGLTYLNAVHATPNVSFVYDPYSRRVASMTDGVGVTTYTYNPSFVDGGQQLAEECFTATGATSCSHTITYGYDGTGRVASRQVSGSGTEAFEFDAIGRLTGHSSDLGAFQLSYLGQTPQVTIRQLLPATSTLKTTWSYLDNTHDRRLSGIANTGLASSQYTNFTFDTSPENFITGVTQDSDASVSEPNPAAQTVSFNGMNQIAEVSGQAYSYDANGNLLSDGEHIYTWDAENRLVGITYASQSGKATTSSYDGLGRRVEIDETPAGGGSAVTSKYVWCGDRLCQARGASSVPTRSYVSEGEYTVGTTNPSLFYAVDQIGSVRRVFQMSSSAPTYDYDPWGVPSQATAPLTDFGFAGMVSHTGSGLGLTWYRAYDPIVGRWNSRDPISEINSTNLYIYVDNDPLDFVDETGKAKKQPAIVRCVGIGYSCGAPMRPPGVNPEYPNVCYQCLQRLHLYPYGPKPDCD